MKPYTYTVSLAALFVTSGALLSAVFTEDFENGLDTSRWYSEPSNSLGLKEIHTDNPHSGDKCLFMKGSDLTVNPQNGKRGCSFMSPVVDLSLEHATIELWLRDVVLQPVGSDGGGSDGWMAIYMNDVSGKWVATVYQTSDLPNEPISVNQFDPNNISGKRTYGTVNLMDLEGWHKLTVIYSAGAEGSVEVLLDGAHVGLQVPIANLGSLGAITIGVGGQYYNTGEWYIDDFSISATSADSDQDGLTDNDEISLYGTDPLDPDSDDDGLLDGTEVDMAAGTGCPDPLRSDSDGDTLLDGEEIDMGTSPCNADTDGDGVGDADDPLPVDPGVTSGWLEESTRQLSSDVLMIELGAFNGPNNNANKGRRGALANRIQDVANSISAGDYVTASEAVSSILLKLDGDETPPDWMDDSTIKTQLYEELMLLLLLIEML